MAAQLVGVGTDERVVAEQIDMIGDQHQIADIPHGIHPTAGI
jgi:hypothetical protein